MALKLRGDTVINEAGKTLLELTNQVASMSSQLSNLLNTVYPVGAIYMSTKATKPSTLFGGTWVQLQGGFIYGTTVTSGDKGESGNGTGTSTGAATGNTGSTALTEDQMPSHRHYGLNWADQWDGQITLNEGSSGHGYNLKYGGGNISGQENNIWTQARGGGQGHTHTLNSHTHAIPYIVVYIWKRTA